MSDLQRKQKQADYLCHQIALLTHQLEHVERELAEIESDKNTYREIYLIKKFNRLVDITYTLCPETGDITAEIL
jgi:prefoldin subunit 5